MPRLRVIAVAAIIVVASSGAVALADEVPTAEPAATLIDELAEPAAGPAAESPPPESTPGEPSPDEPGSTGPGPTEPAATPSDPDVAAGTPAQAPEPSVGENVAPDQDVAMPVGVAPPTENGWGREDEDGCLKLGCDFLLEFADFPEGDLTAAYRIDLWNPSGSGELESGAVQVGEDPASGSADLDGTVALDLTPELLAAVDDGVEPRPNGFHVRLTVDVPGEGQVTVDGHPLTRGHGDEARQGEGQFSKVFWVDCPELPQPSDEEGCLKLDGCVVPIRFSGFPRGDHVAIWKILLWHPSGTGELAAGEVFVGQDPPGDASDLDAHLRVDIADALRDARAIREHNGFHIRVVVAVDVEGTVTIAGSPMEEHEGTDGHDEGQGGLAKTLWIDCDRSGSGPEPDPEPDPDADPTPPNPEPETRVLGRTGLPDATAFTGADVRSMTVAAVGLAIAGLLSLAVAQRTTSVRQTRIAERARRGAIQR